MRRSRKEGGKDKEMIKDQKNRGEGLCFNVQEWEEK
jgi:hypothetical protein